MYQKATNERRVDFSAASRFVNCSGHSVITRAGGGGLHLTTQAASNLLTGLKDDHMAQLKDGHMAQSKPMGIWSTSFVEIVKTFIFFYRPVLPAFAQVTLVLMGSSRKESRSLEVASVSPG